MPRLSLAILLTLFPVHTCFALPYYFNASGTDQPPGASLQTLWGKPSSDRAGELRTLRINLRLSGVDITSNGDGFYSLHVAGLQPLGQLGAPDLQGAGLLLAIPDGIEPTLTIVSQQTRQLDAIAAQPCQFKARCKLPRSQVQFHYDSALYDSQKSFPEAPAMLEELGQMQNVRLVRLALYPLRMNMPARTVDVSTDLEVEVAFAGKPLTRFVSQPFRQMMLQTAFNAEDVAPFYAPAPQTETLLIFAANSLRAELTPLAEWKRQRGMNVELLTYSDVGASRDKARKYLQDYYDKAQKKPSYLLIVGNNSSFPGFRESTMSGSAATDYPYSLLEGGDALPDIFYGRLLANDALEARTQVRRWIDYEKATTDSDWLVKAMTIASNEGDDPSDEDYARQIERALNRFTYKDVDLLFQANSSATHSNIWSGLKEGRSWVAYFGHGTGEDWASTNKMFNVKDVDKVDNVGRLPIVIDVACQNASWVDINRCFGKAWMTLDKSGLPAGAVGYYGGSVNVSWHEPAVMSVGVAKYHFEKPVYSLGAAVLAGQIYMIEQMGLGENTKDNLRWFNLFGDPSMLIRTDNPRRYSVTQHVTLGTTESEILVKASDAINAGVGGLTVSVWAPGANQPLAVETTDNRGVAVLTLPGVSQIPQGSLLTTSGYNVETFQTTL